MEHPKQTLQGLGLSARKSLGQNFLVNLHSLEPCAPLLDQITPMLEIGPGLGAVSSFFLERGFGLTLVEKDQLLADYLKRKLKDEGGCEVIAGDFLSLGAAEMEARKIGQIIGNLPFYITSPILTRIVGELPFVDSLLAGVQLDLGQKICGVGNSLALFLQSQGEIRLVSKVPRNSFYPVPRVDGGWVFWRRNPKADAAAFEIFLRGIFWGRRKTLSASVQKNPFYEKNPHSALWRERLGRLSESEKNLRPDALNIERALELFYKFTGE